MRTNPFRQSSFALRSMVAALMLASLPTAARAEGASRIVSVGGAVTEIVYALGDGGRIAAVDSTSLFPAEARGKANVGYMRALSAEGVLALSPDLILIEDGSGPPDAVALIDQAGVPIVHVPAGHDPKDLSVKVRTIAKALGREVEGEALAKGMEADLAVLKTDLAAVAKPKRVLFILSLVDDRPRAAGRDTAADSIIRLAGATNVLADSHGYKALSWEAAAALQPDVILLMDRGGGDHGIADPLAMPALAETPAAKAKALIRMDALYMLGFGPRTPAAARELASKFYPDLDLAHP